MKSELRRQGLRIGTCLLCAGAGALFALLAAGPLSPPVGPVASSYKTLSEMEPRIAINATNTPGDAGSVYRISTPGSYYLTGNVTGVSGKAGIEIAASNVTIDLMGFTMQGVAGSLDGIRTQEGGDNLTVRNGTVRDFGGAGINFYQAIPTSSLGGLIESIHVSGNNTGIMVGIVFTVRDCTAESNATIAFAVRAGSTLTNCTAVGSLAGILGEHGCTVSHCTVTSQGSYGIYVGASSIVTNTTITGSAMGGISADVGSTISHCAVSSTQTGIQIASSGLIADCVLRANTIDNIRVGSNTVVLDNNCDGTTTSSAGIHATGGGNRIEGNTCRGGSRGLDIDVGGNVIRGNIVSGATTNYDIVAGNQLELIITQLPLTLTWPCTVTLVGDVTGAAGQHGITVSADNVTIDLGGHALIGAAGGTFDGIRLGGAIRNLTVRNGTVRNWSSWGISANSCTGGMFENLMLTNNGGRGLSAGSGVAVRNCTASGNTLDGIAVVDRSVVSGCTSTGQLGGAGFAIGDGSSITDCSSTNNTGQGIYAYNGVTIDRCTTKSNSLDGIRVSFSCTVRHNNCNGDGFAAGTQGGILVDGSGNSVQDNNLTFCDTGIYALSGGNIIIRNTVKGSATTNYNITGGNSYGPIVNVLGVGDISGVGNSNHPAANFSY